MVVAYEPLFVKDYLSVEERQVFLDKDYTETKCPECNRECYEGFGNMKIAAGLAVKRVCTVCALKKGAKVK